MAFTVIFKDTFLEDLERVVGLIAVHNAAPAQNMGEICPLPSSEAWSAKPVPEPAGMAGGNVIILGPTPSRRFTMKGTKTTKEWAESNPDLEIRFLAGLSPQAQGDIDFTLIEANLRLTPVERIEAACRTANDLECLRKALKPGHG